MNIKVLVVAANTTGPVLGNQFKHRGLAMVSDHTRRAQATAVRFGMMLSSLLALAALATGCATAAKQASTAVHGCSELSAEIAKTEQIKRTALEKQRGAWKTVVPFAVAARYASGKSAVKQADKQLDKLNTEFSAKGCEHAATRPT